LVFLSLACGLGRARSTAIPAGRPANFEVQTATPTIDRLRATLALEPDMPEPDEITPLIDAPTHTPDPRTRLAVFQLPTATPAPILVEATDTPVSTSEATDEPAPKPPPAPVELDAPRQGGDWDFETEFIAWPNPYGEPCPGARVALGWTAFVEQGEYGSSCMNENLYRPNVFSGLKSQEMTFDFIAANSGIWRNIPTKVGHRYNIVAYAKHDFSIVPVEMYLGVDLSGGANWAGETVEWFPWDNQQEDTWVVTEETVVATGESMTIFIRGRHPVAEQGGKTVIDNVSVTDVGP
jgi:hypothetical protein